MSARRMTSACLASAAAIGMAGVPLGVSARAETAPVTSTAADAPSGAELPIVEVPFTKFVLPNGLTLLVVENHKAPAVSVQVWHHVGSADETPGHTGFAHLFEHLMFQGSEHSDTDWFKPMNKIGATQMNGTTSYDRTNFFETVPTAALDRTLWLEADRMRNLMPAVTQARLDEQRGVVENEKRQRSNKPGGDIPEQIAEATHPEGHPYSWTPIGSMEDLEAASLDDVRAFFDTWYGAANTVLVLAGDITPEDAKAKAERYFGSIPAGPPIHHRKQWIARMTGEKRDVDVIAVSNPGLIEVWNVPGWLSRDAQLLSLAAELLGDHDIGTLYNRLVRDEKVASSVSVDLSRLELGSQFTIDVTIRQGVDPGRVERLIDEELASFFTSGPAAADLERVKFEHYSAHVRVNESIERQGQMVAQGELYAGRPDFTRTAQQWTYDATPAAIAAAAQRWLSDGAYVLNVVPQPEYTVAPNTVLTGAMPPIGKPAPFALPPIEHATLSNGLKIALVESHDVPTVRFDMVFDVGAVPDRATSLPGLAPVTMRETLNGTTGLSATEITRRQGDLGMSLHWKPGKEFTHYGMSALKIRLDPSLALYSDVLLHPTFPDDEWRLDQANAIAQLNDMMDTAQGKLAVVIPKFVYGPDHPYARDNATPESLAKITTADMKALYRRWIRPDGATLFIVGDTTLGEIMPKLEEALGGWHGKGPAPVKAPLPQPARRSGPRIILIDQPDAKSSIIGVSGPGPVRSAADFDADQIVTQMFGGNFLSRLNMNLREDRHWSYGAKAALTKSNLLGGFQAGSIVQTDKTADAMTEIDRELHDIVTTRPPTEAEVEMAKNGILLGLSSTLGTQAGEMRYYTDAYQYGLAPDYWNGYVDRISGISTAAVEAAAKELIDPSRMTWFVAGDLSRIEADIRKLNLGDVIVVDAEGNRIR